jgi:hypothetical protein
MTVLSTKSSHHCFKKHAISTVPVRTRRSSNLSEMYLESGVRFYKLVYIFQVHAYQLVKQFHSSDVVLFWCVCVYA